MASSTSRPRARPQPLRIAARPALLAFLPVIAVAAPDEAPASVLDPVVISAERAPRASFDSPAALSAVSREVIESAGPQVNLSEALGRVPGIAVLNRQNYAQDLQMSIRGFGARSTFGIRGVRLIVDGIPATMPDGQGQASNIALSSAGRIEVLRGPMAQLYGNAAGGVVHVFTEPDARVPTATYSLAAGSHGLSKHGVKFSTSTPGYGLLVDASHFQTRGLREHSAAQRGQLNVRWQSELTPDTSMRIVLNALDQPGTQDPLGLTRADWASQPEGYAVPLATAQDARKTVRQQQAGTVIDHQFTSDTSLSMRAYLGERGLDNALSIPLAAQQPATSSGGIVQFERSYGGLSAQLTHRVSLGGERALRLTGGMELEHMREHRRGYINQGGEQGALKRDERNRVESRDVFVQAAVDLHPLVTLTGGARTSDVRFVTRDDFVVAGNPDDSGAMRYHATSPVLGGLWRVRADLNVYANAGLGFETPTFGELAYRNGGTGMNIDLRASRSRHRELGLKWMGAHDRLDLAVFAIDTRDEIVVDTSAGGRSTYKNAARTSREGLELSHERNWHPAVSSTFSTTLMRVRFAESFAGSGGAVAAGNRLPGTPERTAFAELRWTPRQAWGGFSAAAQAVHTGSLQVDDRNSDAAPAVTVLNLRASWAQRWGAWRFTQRVHVDNLTDRRYAGSVIVNDANQRFFEPAAGRQWLLAASASYAF